MLAHKYVELFEKGHQLHDQLQNILLTFDYLTGTFFPEVYCHKTMLPTIQ